jgi:hypothetical protein
MTAQMAESTGVFIPPSRGPLGGSVLEYAHIVENAHMSLDPAGVIWSYNCIGIDVDPIDDCADYTTLTKRFDPPASADGGSFVIQGGIVCKPFGFSGDDPALKAAFDTMEPLGVSRGLAFTLFGSAVDLTPAAAVTPVVALGLLESYGYLEYAGQPIIHLGPGMISQLMANGAVVANGGKLSTALGTPVAVSGGYESKTGDKLDQEQWAYVTGAIVLGRGEPVLRTEHNRSTNEIVVLYERLYAVAIDCLLGKVKVKVY